MYDQYDEMDYREQLERMKQPVYTAPEPEITQPPQQEYQPPAEGGVVSFRDTKLAQPEAAVAPAKSTLPLRDQRTARNGMSDLVQRLHGSNQGDWEGIITESLISNPIIYDYVQGITVKAAIEETGADQVLTTNILNALKASPLVPDTTNYGG